jgi:hypothetical protein
MKGVMAVFLLITSFWALAQGPRYFWASLSLPSEARFALSERVQTLGIPTARFVQGIGGLEFTGVTNEEELLASNAFLFLDGDFFLLGIREGEWTTLLRGGAKAAELIILGEPPLWGLSSLAILEALGLLPADGTLVLLPREIPLKFPAPPKEIRLDPVLWALVDHPDWFKFCESQGLARAGLRVRVVAEVSARLPPQWEPFIRSSTDSLAELLIPIPLLPELGKDPAVRLVRPPFVPHPLGG